MTTPRVFTNESDYCPLPFPCTGHTNSPFFESLSDFQLRLGDKIRTGCHTLSGAQVAESSRRCSNWGHYLHWYLIIRSFSGEVDLEKLEEYKEAQLRAAALRSQLEDTLFIERAKAVLSQLVERFKNCHSRETLLSISVCLTIVPSLVQIAKVLLPEAEEWFAGELKSEQTQAVRAALLTQFAVWHEIYLSGSETHLPIEAVWRVVDLTVNERVACKIATCCSHKLLRSGKSSIPPLPLSERFPASKAVISWMKRAIKNREGFSWEIVRGTTLAHQLARMILTKPDSGIELSLFNRAVLDAEGRRPLEALVGQLPLSSSGLALFPDEEKHAALKALVKKDERELVECAKEAGLIHLFRSNSLTVEAIICHSEWINRSFGGENRTLLHHLIGAYSDSTKREALMPLIRAALQAGANPNLRDTEGRMPYLMAKELAAAELLDLFRGEGGCFVMAETLLWEGISRLDDRMVREAVLRYRADPDAVPPSTTNSNLAESRPVVKAIKRLYTAKEALPIASFLLEHSKYLPAQLEVLIGELDSPEREQLLKILKGRREAKAAPIVTTDKGLPLIGIKAVRATSGLGSGRSSRRTKRFDCLESARGESSLFRPLRLGKLPDFRQALSDAKSLVNDPDRDGDTPLHYAALHGFDAAIKLLMDAGAKINQTNRWGWTALHFAALFARYSGDSSIYAELTNRGANELPDLYGNRPKHLLGKERFKPPLTLSEERLVRIVDGGNYPLLVALVLLGLPVEKLDELNAIHRTLRGGEGAVAAVLALLGVDYLKLVRLAPSKEPLNVLALAPYYNAHHIHDSLSALFEASRPALGPADQEQLDRSAAAIRRGEELSALPAAELLNRGRTGGETLLHIALSKLPELSARKAIAALLLGGADPNQKNCAGLSCLNVEFQDEAVRELFMLRAGVTDQKSWTLFENRVRVRLLMRDPPKKQGSLLASLFK